MDNIEITNQTQHHNRAEMLRKEIRDIEYKCWKEYAKRLHDLHLELLDVEFDEAKCTMDDKDMMCTGCRCWKSKQKDKHE